MKTRLLFGVMCLSLILAVSGAQAAIVYDGGAPNSGWGFEMSAYLPAESFTFATPTTVTGVRFWAVESTGAGSPDPGQYYGSIVWQIYGDSGGPTGSALYSGTATPTAVADHATGWGESYHFDFAINPPTLSAGTTYWLALHNGSLAVNSTSNFAWESTGTGGTLAYADPTAWTTWHTYSDPEDARLAFQLQGNPVPLPGAVWLLGSGLLGLIGLRKKLRS